LILRKLLKFAGLYKREIIYCQKFKNLMTSFLIVNISWFNFESFKLYWSKSKDYLFNFITNDFI